MRPWPVPYPIAVLTVAGLLAGPLAGCSSSAIGGQGSSASTPPVSAPASTPDFPSGSAGSVTAPVTPGSSATVSTAAPTPTTSASGQPGVPAGFVGAWDGHSRRLVVGADGSVTIDFRTYVTCTATVTTGCDRLDGNAIHDGGQVIGRVTQVVDPTTVIVTVTSTSVPKIVPDGPFRLGHDLRHHAVAPFVGGLSGVPFCGPGAPSGYCGA